MTLTQAGVEDTSGTRNDPGGGGHSTLEFWTLLGLLMDGSKRLFLFLAAGAATATLIGLMLPPRYTVEASFRPQSDAVAAGQLTSLAAQFGFKLPTGEGAESPDFYLALLDTRGILDDIARRTFRLPSGGDATLDSLLSIKDEDPELRFEAVIDWLRSSALRASADRNTGIVTLRVRTRWSTVSTQLATALLEEVDRFNAQSRRSRASAEATFVSSQAALAEERLRRAENEMKSFLARNRRYTEAPELVFEYDRLRRDVEMQQQLFTSLREGLEQAKIATVRDTPVITVVQPPYSPSHPDSRWLPVKAVIGGFLGFLLGLLVILLQRLAPPTEPHAQATYAKILGVLRLSPRR